ncbi:uncharacterized protein LOC111083838 isoform X2 [Limulus polyphemus]|uniref:Uncharacterized protein LOC111083838 isoform X1 n=1 Tax=Limulus polyphemus TaxID=6850 RepID=A0ABM1RXZ1_LIMPO|nr:uncharacterized protein LOC111083838 isoform X1 [Limulus polyphemus]XP_022236247.1 uncharacterized protein LOC111083838 isoform X2 [Limulus polyphemus]
MFMWFYFSECNKDFQCQGLGEHAHFRNFGMAFLTLFRVATGDNWNGIMKDTLRENCDYSSDCVTNCCVSPIIAPIYFVVFVLMAQFVLVNVVVAVLMKHLEESHTQDEEDLDMEEQIKQEVAAEAGVSQQGSRTTEVREAKRSETKALKPRPLVKMTSLPANFTFTFQGSDGVRNRNVPEIRVVSPTEVTEEQARGLLEPDVDRLRVSGRPNVSYCGSNASSTMRASNSESSTIGRPDVSYCGSNASTTMRASNSESSTIGRPDVSYCGSNASTTMRASNSESSTVGRPDVSYCGSNASTTMRASNSESSTVGRPNVSYCGSNASTTMRASNSESSTVGRPNVSYCGSNASTTMRASNSESSTVGRPDVSYYGSNAFSTMRASNSESSTMIEEQVALDRSEDSS